MAHSDAREGKWRGKWRMEWVASTLHTTSEHGVSSITIVDAHTSAVSSRLNWCTRRFKWTRPFRRKTKSDFCACAITFQLASTNIVRYNCILMSTRSSSSLSPCLLLFLRLTAADTCQHTGQDHTAANCGSQYIRGNYLMQCSDKYNNDHNPFETPS